MNKRRLMEMILTGIVLLVLSACGSQEIPNAKNWDVEDFTFTDQEGMNFSKSDLKGKVWIADFIFTSCVDVCQPMTANMTKLQKLLKEEGIKNVEFVSFSVDPAVDKPYVLKKFANQFHVDYTNWHFLTGYEQKEIEQLALKDFKTIVAKPKNEDQVTHGVDFYLINQEGKIVQTYSGLDKKSLDAMIRDIKILQK